MDFPIQNHSAISCIPINFHRIFLQQKPSITIDGPSKTIQNHWGTLHGYETLGGGRSAPRAAVALRDGHRAHGGTADQRGRGRRGGARRCWEKPWASEGEMVKNPWPWLEKCKKKCWKTHVFFGNVWNRWWKTMVNTWPKAWWNMVIMDNNLVNTWQKPAKTLQNNVKHGTSSTAQGGGGSFKNRKPIGEIGCCESGMAERSHWWTERCLISLTLSLAIYLPTHLFSMYLIVSNCI